MRMFSAILISFMLTNACLAEPSMLQKLQANTVVLMADEYGHHGSGFLFTRDDCQSGQVTFIWTAAHVVVDWMQDDGFCLPVPTSQGDRHGKAEVLRMSNPVLGDDIALLRVVEGDFYGISKFYRAFNETKLGQKVTLCGTPINIRWNERLLTFGRIAYLDRLMAPGNNYELHFCDQINIISYGGNSGSLVTDEETGDILGMIVMGSGIGIAAIEPTRHIYQFAKDHDCLWAFDRSYPLPETLRAWPSDWHLANVRERDCDLDYEWGSSVPRTKPKPTPTLAPPPVFPAPPEGIEFIPIDGGIKLIIDMGKIIMEAQDNPFEVPPLPGNHGPE